MHKERCVDSLPLRSLRLEKGYRDYGHDVDNLDTLLEAGLGFTADLAKPGSFRGAAALAAELRTRMNNNE